MSSRTKARAKRKSIAAQAATGQGLPVLRTDAGGIDVGSTEHWVCCPPKPDGSANVQSFGTTTRELEKQADWLQAEGVKSVAMESTGVYWIPLYEVLESRGFEVLLANAKQLANVPGRKTDMADCQWLQLLHSCGLLRGSFRPSEEVCQLRALMRECSNLIDERSRKVQRMQKALDQMNVQVHRAVTDITGTTGMDIIRAIVDGERDPLALAGLRDKRCSKSVQEFAEHLRGTWREEHLFNLSTNLQLYDKLNEMIEVYHGKIAELMQRCEPEDRRAQRPPDHPNPTKAKATLGVETVSGSRRDAAEPVAVQWRGPHPYRRDQYGCGHGGRHRSRTRPQRVPYREALHLVAAAGATSTRVGRQGAQEEAQRGRRHPLGQRTAHVRLLSSALRHRFGGSVPSHLSPQRPFRRRLRHGPKARHPDLPYAALRRGLR